FGASCSFLLTPTLPEFATICERHGLGTLGSAYSLFNIAYALGMAVGPVLAGALEPLLGLPLTLVAFGLGALAYLPILARGSAPAAAASHESRPVRSAA